MAVINKIRIIRECVLQKKKKLVRQNQSSPSEFSFAFRKHMKK